MKYKIGYLVKTETDVFGEVIGFLKEKDSSSYKINIVGSTVSFVEEDQIVKAWSPVLTRVRKKAKVKAKVKEMISSFIDETIT